MSYIITIRDYHDTDGQIEKSVLTTSAEISGTAEDYTILYDEQSDELKGCKTTVHVTNGRCVEIVRKGRYNTEIRIEQGKRNACYYATPFGQIVMGVYSNRVESQYIENKETSLNFSYTLDYNNSLLSKNRLKISVKCKEAN